MKDLIERLENTKGPNFRLEQEIMWAVREIPQHQRSDHDKPPVYTASIDAALTLVPEGAGLCLERHWNRSGIEWTAAIFTGGVPDNPARQFTADASAPAIALCIAALKARTLLSTYDANPAKGTE